MKRLFLFIFIITICFPVLSQATTFSSKDLAGDWRGCFMETTAANTTRLLRSVRLEVSPTNVVSGIWSDKGYSNATLGYGNITGGSLHITSKGEITGSIDTMDAATLVEDTINIINGWMDTDKNIFYIVTKKPGGQLSTGLFVKYQHTYNGFPTSDLEGIWFINNIQSSANSGGDDEGDWVVDILSTASDGSCTGNWYSSGNSVGTINVGSSLSLDPSYGWITGTLFSNTSDINIYTGQLSSDKNIGTAAATLNIQAPSGGELTSGTFLRGGGDGFIGQDLQGTWALYSTEVYSGTNMYWLYGEITLDQSGTLVRGNWYGPNAESGTFTAGKIDIAISGVLFGHLTSSLGYTSTIKQGLLSLSKNQASFTMEYGTKGVSGHRQNSVFMIRKSNNAITPMIQLLLE